MRCRGATLQEFALLAFVNQLGLEASSGYGVLVNFAMLIPSALMQSLASFVSQNVGAGDEKRVRKAMFTGICIGLVIGCIMFVGILFKGDLLTSFFTPDQAAIQNGHAYLKGFALEAIVTAVLVFSTRAKSQVCPICVIIWSSPKSCEFISQAVLSRCSTAWEF